MHVFENFGAEILKNTPRTPPQEEIYFEKCSQEHASDAVNNKILLV